MSLKNEFSAFVAGFLICLAIVLPMIIVNAYPLIVNKEILETELSENVSWFDDFTGFTWIKCNCSGVDYYIILLGKNQDIARWCELLNETKMNTGVKPCQ
jgi:hypothetical protein